MGSSCCKPGDKSPKVNLNDLFLRLTERFSPDVNRPQGIKTVQQLRCQDGPWTLKPRPRNSVDITLNDNIKSNKPNPPPRRRKKRRLSKCRVTFVGEMRRNSARSLFTEEPPQIEKCISRSLDSLLDIHYSNERLRKESLADTLEFRAITSSRLPRRRFSSLDDLNWVDCGMKYSVRRDTMGDPLFIRRSVSYQDDECVTGVFAKLRRDTLGEALHLRRLKGGDDDFDIPSYGLLSKLRRDTMGDALHIKRKEDSFCIVDKLELQKGSTEFKTYGTETVLEEEDCETENSTDVKQNNEQTDAFVIEIIPGDSNEIKNDKIKSTNRDNDSGNDSSAASSIIMENDYYGEQTLNNLLTKINNFIISEKDYTNYSDDSYFSDINLSTIEVEDEVFVEKTETTQKNIIETSSMPMQVTHNKKYSFETAADEMQEKPKTITAFIRRDTFGDVLDFHQYSRDKIVQKFDRVMEQNEELAEMSPRKQIQHNMFGNLEDLVEEEYEEQELEIKWNNQKVKKDRKGSRNMEVNAISDKENDEELKTESNYTINYTSNLLINQQPEVKENSNHQIIEVEQKPAEITNGQIFIQENEKIDSMANKNNCEKVDVKSKLIKSKSKWLESMLQEDASTDNKILENSSYRPAEDEITKMLERIKSNPKVETSEYYPVIFNSKDMLKAKEANEKIPSRKSSITDSLQEFETSILDMLKDNKDESDTDEVTTTAIKTSPLAAN